MTYQSLITYITDQTIIIWRYGHSMYDGSVIHYRRLGHSLYDGSVIHYICWRYPRERVPDPQFQRDSVAWLSSLHFGLEKSHSVHECLEVLSSWSVAWPTSHHELLRPTSHRLVTARWDTALTTHLLLTARWTTTAHLPFIGECSLYPDGSPPIGWQQLVEPWRLTFHRLVTARWTAPAHFVKCLVINDSITF